MRVVLGIALPVLGAIADAGLGSYLSIGEVRPDVLALVVVSWSLAAGAAEGLWWAFAGGLAADVLTPSPSAFGTLTASLLPVALVFGAGRSRGRDPRLPTALALLAGAAALHQALYALLLLVLGRPLPEPAVIALISIGAGLYTGALGAVAYPLLRALHRRTARGPAFD